MTISAAAGGQPLTIHRNKLRSVSDYLVIIVRVSVRVLEKWPAPGGGDGRNHPPGAQDSRQHHRPECMIEMFSFCFCGLVKGCPRKRSAEVIHLILVKSLFKYGTSEKSFKFS